MAVKKTVEYIIDDYNYYSDSELVEAFEKYQNKLSEVGKTHKRDLSVVKTLFSIYINMYELSKAVKLRTGMRDEDFPVKLIDEKPTFNFNIN